MMRRCMTFLFTGPRTELAYVFVIAARSIKFFTKNISANLLGDFTSGTSKDGTPIKTNCVVLQNLFTINFHRMMVPLEKPHVHFP